MAEANGWGLAQIGQIAVPVQDLERSVAFYRDRLGMKHLFSAPPNLAFFDCDGIRLMLGLPENDEARNHGSVIYFTVPDIQIAFDTLSSRDVKFDQGPHVIAQLGPNDLWMAFFRDSEGNLLSIMSEAPHR